MSVLLVLLLMHDVVTDLARFYSFQVNDLATGLLGLLLLPLLSKTATLPSPTPDIAFKPRLTFVGSESTSPAQAIRLSRLTRGSTVHQWASFTESKVEGSTLDALNNPNHFVPDEYVPDVYYLFALFCPNVSNLDRSRYNVTKCTFFFCFSLL